MVISDNWFAFALLFSLHSCLIIINVQDYENDNPPNSNESIQDYTYLSNEKDVALWKMLVASPTNCNVFVGGLGHGVTSEILHAAFETFSMNEEEKQQIKVV